MAAKKVESLEANLDKVEALKKREELENKRYEEVKNMLLSLTNKDTSYVRPVEPLKARAPFRLWEELKRRLLDQFQPSQEGNLHEQFLSITQDGSAREYVGLCEQLVGQLRGVSEEVIEGTFIKGLKPDLRSSVRVMKPEQQDYTSESSMTLLNILMETCATLSQKVTQLKQDKIAQALEILKLKRRVKKLKKKRRLKPSGLKRLRKVGTSQRVESSTETIVGAHEDASKQSGRIEAIDVDEDITLVDAKTQVDVKLQGRKDDDNAATKDASAAEPTVFDDEEGIQQSSNFFKLDKDVEEPTKKRVAEETLLQESFKKLKAVEVSCSHSIQDTPTHDPKEMSKEDVQNMLEIVLVFKFKVKALQVKYHLIDWDIHSEGSRSYWKIIKVDGITEAYQSSKDMLKGFDREDLDALWRLVKEDLVQQCPQLTKRKLYGVHHVSSTKRHDIFMLTEKDYPLSNDVMIMMLSAKLQVEEDSEIARDLVMKIFMEANKPKSRKQAAEEEDEVEVPNALTPLSPTNEPSPPQQDPITTPPQAQPAPPSSPPQEQQDYTSESSMTLLNTLMETCATLSQKVTQLKQDKIAQALEILKLKRRVKKLKKKRRSKPSGLKRGRIEAIDVDEDITLVDAKTQVDVELQGRKYDDNAATKDASAVEPTVFDDKEVTTTMAQKLIKMKAEKATLLDEQIAKRLHDEEVEQAAAKKKQENDDLKKAKVLQKQKNMIIYLKNMAGYKMKHFRGMTYDKVRPIFKKEYNKVQTFFKLDKDVEEPTKKRVAEETLLQESFKKLKAVEVSCSYFTQDTPTHDPKEMSEEDVQNMLEIVPVFKFKVKSLQVKYHLIDWEIHSEGSRSYWKNIRVGGITEAYQSSKVMLKGFDREDLDAL
nr:ankyrin repeat-containing protein [Tanacetum cinerariifolium]